ncbi:MAG TPA: type II secretion system F family protein [Terriglobales bacterium]|nr:type II secretion system F family protein [Terriglobales bacterium]
MQIILFVLLFMTVAAALFAFFAATLAPTSALGFRLRSLLPQAQDAKPKPKLEERLHEQVIDPLSKVLPKSPDEVSSTRQLLMNAGYREAKHLTFYFGIRVLLGISLLGFFLLSGLAARKPLLFFVALAAAYILPRFALKRMITARQARIRLALADALDLAVICVEAGLGLDQAIQRVGSDLQHSHPELSEEFNLVNLEMRAGKPRADALRNLANRTGVDDVRSLVAVLVQTDRFGTSIAQALRVHSDALRTERRQRAEEQAAKTTIKMVPVLVFFVFPSMFIVSIGPAFIQMIRHLLPVINQ